MVVPSVWSGLVWSGLVWSRLVSSRIRPHLASVVFAILLCVPALCQRLAYATHDWAGNRLNPAEDRWADVKTPGNGWTYSVGSTRAPTTDPLSAPIFSAAPVTGPAPFRTQGTQVVILQANNLANPAQSWQRYFYGQSMGQPNGLASFARAVATYIPQWPGATRSDWRIAICGESYDGLLPEAPPGVGSQFGWLWPKGFLAVYDGRGELLWSNHFYPTGTQTVAITDIAIHTEGVGTAAVDVVTYCGMTDAGGGAGQTMATQREFVSLSVQTPCGLVSYPSGAGIAGIPTGQKDGFIGRLTAPHINFVPGPNPVPALVTSVFACLVGAAGDDGLLGIAEITQDRFAVVGTASLVASSLVPPITIGSCMNQAVGTFGYVAVFDASQIRVNPTTGVLVLEYGEMIGVPQPLATVYSTEPRDVAILGGHLCVVGATDNPALPNAQNALVNGAARAGFILQCSGLVTIGGVKSTFYVQPTDGTECQLVGVGGWSEFDDHIYCAGWMEKAMSANPPLPTRRHGFVVSLFRDTTTNASGLNLVPIRMWGLDDTVVSSFLPASTPGGATNSGWPTSGGIAVDERGSVTVVGSTYGGIDFPFTSQGLGMEPNHASSALEHDACAVVVDLLPPLARRSDGSGDPASPWVPSTTADGGTTPVCGRALYGRAIGVSPSLPRMMIDIEGLPGPGNQLSILVDRPPASSGLLSLGFLRIGLPNLAPEPTLLATYGIEFWMNLTDWMLSPQVVNGGSIRDPLFGSAGLPIGSYGFSVQFYTLMSQGFVGCPASYTFASSPALYFEY